MYIVGVSVYVSIYSFSRVIQDEDKRIEAVIIEDYIDNWVRKNLHIINRQGFKAPDINSGRLYFTALAAN